MSIHFGGFNLNGETDCYGFEKDRNLDQIPYQEFISDYIPTLARRTKRWEKLYRPSKVDHLPHGLFANRKVKRFIRKGVPASLRPKIWMQVTEADNLMLSNPGEFQKLSRLVLPEDTKRAIELDLHRTFPDNIYFKPFPGNFTVQMDLILNAFAAKNPNIGYCQGLNFICAMFYLILKNAESSFWLMVAVIDKLPDDFYDSNMQGLQKKVENLNQLITQYEPEIGFIFQKYGADMSMFTTKWFICWFLETLPIETVLRIWDCFFNEGSQILMRVAFTLIVHNKDKFLKCNSFTNIADVMKIIAIDPFALNCHEFMNEVFSLPNPIRRAIKQMCSNL